MLTVEFSQLATTRDSLRIGLVIRYGENGPVRFAQLVIGDDALEWQALTDIANWLVRQTNRHLDREADLADDQIALDLEL